MLNTAMKLTAPPSRLPSSTAPTLSMQAIWPMMLALTTAFALSQAYRTVIALMAVSLQGDFHLDEEALGLFAGCYHFAFAGMQLFMGIGIDLHGVRRTVLVAFPLAIAGAVVSAMAHNYAMLVLGQILIGVGCAPTFLVCTVFIARHLPPLRFAAVSGLVLGLGGIGMLITGTPLAWLIQATSWLGGYWALGGFSVLSWLLIFRLVHEPSTPAPHSGSAAAQRESVGQAIKKFGALFTMPHTLGILLLASVGYASFIALRGLWLGPMLIQRHGFSLVQSGNVALAM